MKLRKRYLLAMTMLGLIAVVLPAIAGSEPLSVIAVNESGAGCGYSVYPTECHHWTNPQQTIASGESVKFSNPYTGLPYHGLKFTEGPGGAPPSVSSICSGISTTVEGAGGAANWKGECKFTQPGVYAFICTVHPSEMKGTITVPGAPTDATTSASGQTQTEAMLNGSIDPEGNTVGYRFEYEGPGVTGKQSTPTATLSAADFTSHSVSAQVTGLQPGMTYHFLLVATYGGKTVAGATTQTFTTHAVTAPTATTLAAEGLKETEATLKGTVNPGGEATEYFFEYGTGTGYGQTTEKATVSASGSNQTVSATLTKLTPGTEYHFRLVAKNKLGSEKSAEGIFKTLSPPEKTPPPTTTTTSTTPPPTTTTPLVEPPPGPSLTGSPSLRSTQRGTSVKGSLDVSQTGAGGRLEVDLIAKSASLARRGRSKQVTVGRLVRTSVSAGRMSFSVALNARGKSALRRHHRLALSVKITLTPTQGAAVTVTRSVVLHA
jgi:plastocyanin